MFIFLLQDNIKHFLFFIIYPNTNKEFILHNELFNLKFLFCLKLIYKFKNLNQDKTYL